MSVQGGGERLLDLPLSLHPDLHRAGMESVNGWGVARNGAGVGGGHGPRPIPFCRSSERDGPATSTPLAGPGLPFGSPWWVPMHRVEQSNRATMHSTTLKRSSQHVSRQVARLLARSVAELAWVPLLHLRSRARRAHSWGLRLIWR